MPEARAALGIPETTRGIVLWGSSSMASEGGGEGAPVPVRLHELLAAAAAPLPVILHGERGGILSTHTLLQRGLAAPTVHPLLPAAQAIGRAPVGLDPVLPPRGALDMPGMLGRIPGHLRCTAPTGWEFVADDPRAALAPAVFRSSLGAAAEGMRQVLWMGKNNIEQVDQVLADVQAMWDAARDPAEDSLVLGQWPTPLDPRGSATEAALSAVNAEQARRYGRRFLDLRSLLATAEGLASVPVLAPLRLQDDPAVAADLQRGHVPHRLVARDERHLNAWGNLAVGWALVRRMKELRWL
ncbi:hypothetical protein JSY14_07730 [Brachybacterium sp. EF45031]|nr:hypothetical protein [Brachybacterium sillae]